ncbi:MAG TPA: hypothetical protein VG994_02595 [Steroidobacteraceae bacterium]|nr:hypothetical protein [Steroidobacteraceae bacterium]
MTPDELRAAKALCEKATDGPWGVNVHLEVSNGHRVVAMQTSHHKNKADAAFIAASRQLVPQLIAEVERLQAELTKWRPEPISVSVWYMRDNHTFKKLDGDIDAVIEQARRTAYEDPYGMLGSAIVKMTTGEERRVGASIHARIGFAESDLLEWRESVLADPDVARLLAPTDSTPRCSVCRWPLAASAAVGCTATSCSQRSK